jgi:thermopsin
MVGFTSRPGLAVAVVAIMVLGSLGLLAGVTANHGGPGALSHDVLPTRSGPAPTAPAPPSPASPSGLSHALALEQGLRAKGINPATIHIPNFAGAVSKRDQPIVPGYTQAPAPMGVADIGLENRSGVLTPYALNSTSVAGTVNITNLQSLYVDGDGPDTYGIQENSVVAGVTIFGNSSYQFWSQNYIDYTPSTQQLVFGDEVWNFSDPSGYFPTSSIYSFSPNGTFEDFPYLYQGFGPAITIAYPFTLTLYLNTSIIADRPALYFNYTVSNDSFSQSSSFDYLIFNSTVGTPTAAAPIPYYQADGYQYDPIGLINDMEIDILGNDDGDTTSFYAADATVSLQFWNATAGAMEEVPSAFSAGQETGETSSGLLVTSSGGPSPIGVVHAGPGLVNGLWNYSGTSGVVAETITINPTNAYPFLFVNVGSTENDSAAEWAPTSTTGTSTFYLPTGGTYYLEYLLSGYDPASQVVTATASGTLATLHLTANPSLGVYTPLFAFNNAELAHLASSGAGTAGNPYLIAPDQPGSLAPQFATWDDFQFPVFPGLLIAGTTAWAHVTPPSFEIDLPSWSFNGFAGILGLPDTNNLQLQFYDASNLSLVNAPRISGWLSGELYEYPEASVIVWGCTNVLVASNVFYDQGNGLLLYGGSNNTVWGNSFLPATTSASNPGSVDDSASITGVNESESGDLVYNNLFAVALPAYTPTYDPFQCDQYGYCYYVAYNDTWNVSQEPASAYTTVDGWNLTGSIIGTWYQGGNFWSNYGTSSNPFGVLPYNDSAAIANGGDYVPLVASTLYPVTFLESGLAAGTTWNLTANGVTLSSSTASIVAWDPNGTYPLSVPAPAGYRVTLAPPQYFVAGSANTFDIEFAPLATLQVNATGLPTWPNQVWWATVNGTTGGPNETVYGQSAPSAVLSLSLPAGSYTVSAGALGYSTAPGPTDVTVIGLSTSVSFAFTPNPGRLNLTVFPSSASVWVDGQPVTLTTGIFDSTVPAGLTSIEATSPGDVPYFANVTVSPSATTNVLVTLTAIPLGTLRFTVSPGSASVWVDGAAVPLTSGAYSGSESPGVHSIEVTASGYAPYFNNVSVTAGATSSLTIALTAVSPTSNSTTPAAGISTTGWAIIGVLAVVALILLIGLLYFATRSRRGAGDGTVPPAEPWQETKGGPPPSPPSE